MTSANRSEKWLGSDLFKEKVDKEKGIKGSDLINLFRFFSWKIFGSKNQHSANLWPVFVMERKKLIDCE